MNNERTAPYTTKELAAAGNVTDAYIRHLLLHDKLVGEKRGRDWLIPADVGRAWLAERQRKTE